MSFAAVIEMFPPSSSLTRSVEDLVSSAASELRLMISSDAVASKDDGEMAVIFAARLVKLLAEFISMFLAVSEAVEIRLEEMLPEVLAKALGDRR